MAQTQTQILHEDGPFKDILPGDTIAVIYHGAQISIMKVVRVKRHALEGKDGEEECRVTMVTPQDLRFYAKISEVRMSVLRPVRVVKYGTE